MAPSAARWLVLSLPAVSAVSTLPYDCQSALESVDSWDEDQLRWCCTNEGLGCPGDEGDGAGAVAHDCQHGLDSWEWDWTPEKKEWCCEHEQRGCVQESIPPTFDCQVGKMEDWPPVKAEWCCKNEGLGCSCSGECVITGDSASCGDHVRWFVNMQQIRDEDACERGHDFVLQHCPACYGCTLAKVCTGSDQGGASREQYDCNAPDSDTWPPEQKQWCCARGFLGCSRDTSAAAGAAAAGAAVPPADAGVAQLPSRQPAGHRAEPAVPSSAEPLPVSAGLTYDCGHAVRNWQQTWSYAKAHWCCRNHGVGCPVKAGSGAGGDLYDCQVELESWKSSWSYAKAAWCCQHRDLGCLGKPTAAPPTMSKPYDCTEGLNNWALGWSTGKKAWCCLYEGRACSTTLAVNERYDCSVGIRHWVTGWSRAKKTWCCDNHVIDCPSTTTETTTVITPPATSSKPYDCSNAELGGWSIGKQAWCCLYEKTACSTSVSIRRWTPRATTTTTTTTTVATTTTLMTTSTPPATSTTTLTRTLTTSTTTSTSTLTRTVTSTLTRTVTTTLSATATAAAPTTRSTSRPARTSSPPFDCHAGLSNWKKGWSAAKKSWCCRHESLGCKHRDPKQPYDCQAGLANWKKEWPVQKQEWCCLHERHGCLGPSVLDRFEQRRRPLGRLGAWRSQRRTLALAMGALCLLAGTAAVRLLLAPRQAHPLLEGLE